MKYGYYNALLTELDEDIHAETEQIKEHVTQIFVDTEPYRPRKNELLDVILRPGDSLYIYSFRGFCTGLEDLDALLTELIDEKQVILISLRDGFDSSTARGKGARWAFEEAVRLCSKDPQYNKKLL